ncbi:hypothetical protein ES703_66395 [subsurface metagenome]
MPEHPGTGSKPKELIFSTKVILKYVFLKKVNQGISSPLNDAFGSSGSASGIQDVERVVKGELLKLDFKPTILEQKILIVN